MTDAQTGERPAPTLFTQLVMMLSTSAFQQMGKLANPMTGKAEMHLQDAEAIISLIEMLEKKTGGNLDPAESRFLRDTLTSLRLTYVETVRDSAAQPATEQAGPAPAAAAETEPPAPEPSDAKAKQPKFHKKYE